MLDSRLEYLAILLTLCIFTVSLFGPQIKLLRRKSEFWCALTTFLLMGFGLDLIAMSWGWWSFANTRVIGLHVGQVPIEEFVLFIVIFILAISAWEAFDD